MCQLNFLEIGDLLEFAIDNPITHDLGYVIHVVKHVVDTDNQELHDEFEIRWLISNHDTVETKHTITDWQETNGKYRIYKVKH